MLVDGQKKFLAIRALLTVTVAIAWLLSALGPYLQSASANCEDNEVRRADIVEEFAAIWVRRNCGMLYGGGPYTILKLKQNKFFNYFGSEVDVIEIEDEHGNFMPHTELVDDRLLLSGVPTYARFKLVGKTFGLEVALVAGSGTESSHREGQPRLYCVERKPMLHKKQLHSVIEYRLGKRWS